MTRDYWGRCALKRQFGVDFEEGRSDWSTNQPLQIHFHPDIRFRFGIMA